MTATIRLAEPDDCAAIEAIVEAAFGPYIARIGRKPAPMLDDYAARIAEQRVHVLQQDGRVEGFVVLLPETGAMMLDTVAVAPAAQGRGLGRMLLEFAEEAARAAGYATLKLYTNVAMTENILLYRRIGYVETGRLEQKGFSRVNMAKTL